MVKMTTVWKVSKYGVISGPYFPIFSHNTGKYGPEITPYLDTFHAVLARFTLHTVSFWYLEINRPHSFLDAARDGDIRTVDQMLKDGMPVDVIDLDGWTALHRAAMFNQTEVAKLLLRAGADIDKQDNNGGTPLHFAALYNKAEVARLLMDEGADASLKNGRNKTPLDCAYDDQEVKRLLLELQEDAP